MVFIFCLAMLRVLSVYKIHLAKYEHREKVARRRRPRYAPWGGRKNKMVARRRKMVGINKRRTAF